MRVAPQVGIGTATPQALTTGSLHVWQNVSASAFYGDGSNLTNLSASTSISSSYPWEVSASNYIYPTYISSSVGVGTIPNYPLHVYSSGSTVFSVEGSQGTLFQVRDSFVGTLFEVNDISGIPILEVKDTDTVSMGTYGLYTLYVTGSSVGIGTTITGKKLHVFVDTSFDGIAIENTASTELTMIRFDSDTVSNAIYNAGTNVAGNLLGFPRANTFEVIANTGSLMLGAVDPNARIIFGVGSIGNTSMIIDENENVGIGTTAPANKVQIYVSSSATTDDITIGDNDSDAVMVLDRTALGGLTTRLHINNSGATGHTAADILLQADSVVRGLGTYYFNSAGSDNWYLGTPYNTQNVFVLNYQSNASFQEDTADLANNLMLVKTTGEVGIGTTNPAESLTVVGNTHVSGNIKAIDPNGPGWIELDADSNPQTITFADLGDGLAGSSIQSNDYMHFYSGGGGSYFAWTVSGIETARMTFARSLGIGTNAPTAFLHIIQNPSYTGRDGLLLVGEDTLVISHSTDNVGIGTKVAAVGTDSLHVWGDISASQFYGTIAGEVSQSTPDAPTGIDLTDVDSYVTVEFSQSATSGINEYEIWRAQVSETSSYSLVGLIKEDSIAPTMSFIDNSYTISGSLFYRIYSLKAGKRSAALTGQISASGEVGDVTDLEIVQMTHNYFIQYNIPNDRRFSNVTIKKDANADSASLSEGAAVEIYSGRNGTYMYNIPDGDLAKYHQFWVYTTTNT